MVYDSRRGRIVVIGQRIFDYNASTDTWINVTPTDWPGYKSPMGVYHPTLDAMFFRGSPMNATIMSDHFMWHKIKFGSGPDNTTPSSPYMHAP